MTAPFPRVRPIRPDEVGAALGVAAAAFAGDPFFVHLYPDAATRATRFAVEHRAYVRHVYAPYGVAEVAEADGQVAGLALWLPPEAAVPGWRTVPMAWALARAVGVRRFAPALADYGAFDAAAPAERHWYLGLLAVAPSAQGQGIGGALLRAGLARADRDGVGTYLTTATEASRTVYRRFGFEPVHEVALPHGPAHTGMWRPPSRTP